MAGAAGALLLQGGILLLFLASMPEIVAPVPPGRELVFTLPRLVPQPLSPLPRPQPRATVPRAPVPLPFLQAPAPAIAPPAASAMPELRSFGQALNGCTPEQYQNLPAEQKAHCIRPGAGMAMEASPLHLPSQAKDHDTWQEQWDEAHWMPVICGPDQGESVVDCLIRQTTAEHERTADARYRIAQAKAAALKPPPPKIPENVGDGRASASKNGTR
jgi:hypothetical protein